MLDSSSGMKARVKSEGSQASKPYEAPVLAALGTLHELTLYCDKKLGASDGFTFMGAAIVCNSSA